MIRVLRENKTLKEILIGILFFMIIIIALCFAFSDRPVYCMVGTLAGTLGAVFMVIHMAYTIEDMVLLNEKEAVGYARKMTVIRYVVVLTIVVLIGITRVGSPVLCVIGLLLLKAGAYMQPFVHSIFFAKNDSSEIALPFDREDVSEDAEITDNKEGGE